MGEMQSQPLHLRAIMAVGRGSADQFLFAQEHLSRFGDDDRAKKRMLTDLKVQLKIACPKLTILQMTCPKLTISETACRKLTSS